MHAGARLYPVEEATLGATANRRYNQGGAGMLEPMAGNGAPIHLHKPRILPTIRYKITPDVGLPNLFAALPLYRNNFNMKTTVLFFGLMLSLNALAQVADSVIIGPAYPNKGFYSLSNGNVGQMPNTNWDLQFASHSSMSSTLRLNGGFNVRAWEYTAGDSSQWAQLDTAGLGTSNGWLPIYDAMNSFDPGAFEMTATGFPNYGWGTYNQISHDIVGSKLFVVQTRSGAYKKLFIKALRAGTQELELRIANLNGSAESNFSASRAGLVAKSWIYIDLDNASVSDPEPLGAAYDLTFEKYLGLASPGVYYPVTGVRLNRNVQAVRVVNTHVDDVDASGLTLGGDLVAVGHDWKTFAGTAFVLADSMSFFVEDQQGDLWQLWFTGFVGSSAGKFVFNKRKIGTASVDGAQQNQSGLSVQPNPVAQIGHWLVRLPAGVQQACLYVRNLQGQTVHQVALSGQGWQDLAFRPEALGLTSGIYLVSLEAGLHSRTERMVVR